MALLILSSLQTMTALKRSRFGSCGSRGNFPLSCGEVTELLPVETCEAAKEGRLAPHPLGRAAPRFVISRLEPHLVSRVIIC